MFAVRHNVPCTMSKLDELRRLVDGGWQREMVDKMDMARRLVTVLTPKSKGKKRYGEAKAKRKLLRGRRGRFARHAKARRRKYVGHLRDGWKVRTIGKGGKDRVPVLSVIYNRLTHKPDGTILERAKVTRLSKGGNIIFSHGPGGKEYTILDILEYGSKAHTITPKQRIVLRFEVGGKVIFTKRVKHPGTKAHGMVRITKAKLAMWLKKLNAKWKAKFDRSWRNPCQSP